MWQTSVCVRVPTVARQVCPDKSSQGHFPAGALGGVQPPPQPGLPLALLVGAKADVWGPKPLFLHAFHILSVRAALFALSDDPLWLIALCREGVALSAWRFLLLGLAVMPPALILSVAVVFLGG